MSDLNEYLLCVVASVSPRRDIAKITRGKRPRLERVQWVAANSRNLPRQCKDNCLVRGSSTFGRRVLMLLDCRDLGVDGRD